MMIHRSLLLVMLLVGAVLAASCAAPTVQPVAPMQATAPAAQPATPAEAATPPSSGEAVQVDLDEIFPPGEGRELVLTLCTTCHTWVPIVILQPEESYWWQISRDHRDRVPGITDEEYNTLMKYLIANFNPDRPVPELPPELLDTWTSY